MPTFIRRPPLTPALAPFWAGPLAVALSRAWAGPLAVALVGLVVVAPAAPSRAASPAPRSPGPGAPAASSPASRPTPVASPPAAVPSPAARSALGGVALASRGVVAAPGSPPLPPGLSASSWLVADLDTGQVLAARDAHGRFAPASTLKTLTAVTLIPRLPQGRTVRPSFADIAVDGSKVGLVDTLAYPVRELFIAMLVASGNDAAGTLATAAGGLPRTVALMNAEAAHLHAADTHVVNPSGLDAPGQASSAYDLALIGRAGMALPAFRSYVAVRTATVAAPKGKRFQISTHNRLLRSYPGTIGIKNGFTVRARSSFVGAAARGGHRLVVTLMHANPTVATEAAALLDWGFAATAKGVAPVGRLVEPGGAAAPAVPAVMTHQEKVAPRGVGRALEPVRESASRPYGPVAVAGLAFATLLVVRRRRRVRSRR